MFWGDGEALTRALGWRIFIHEYIFVILFVITETVQLLKRFVAEYIV